MRRKHSLLRFVPPAVAVGVVLYVAQIWPFQRTPAPPPVRIPTITEPVRDLYDGLQPDFRAMVPLGEFASMFQRMKDFEGGEAPKLAEALATEPAGAEPLIARFRVEESAGKTGGEYEFARVEGVWRLEKYAHDPHKRPSPGQGATPVSPDSVQPKAAEKKAVPGGAPPTVAAQKAVAVATSPGSWPRSYVIQPGDRLETISRQVYGTSRHWRRILEANPGLDPKRLSIGRRIVIPAPPEHPPDHSQEPEAAPEAAKH